MLRLPRRIAENVSSYTHLNDMILIFVPDRSRELSYRCNYISMLIRGLLCDVQQRLGSQTPREEGPCTSRIKGFIDGQTKSHFPNIKICIGPSTCCYYIPYTVPLIMSLNFRNFYCYYYLFTISGQLASGLRYRASFNSRALSHHPSFNPEFRSVQFWPVILSRCLPLYVG